jgi:hypothetical protein
MVDSCSSPKENSLLQYQREYAEAYAEAESWTSDPAELLDLCRYFMRRDLDVRPQMHTSLKFHADKIEADDMVTILNWWHTDMEKRKLLNVMLHCGEDGPAAEMFNCWSKLNEDQRNAIRVHGRLTASWHNIRETGGNYVEAPSLECLAEIEAVAAAAYEEDNIGAKRCPSDGLPILGRPLDGLGVHTLWSVPRTWKPPRVGAASSLTHSTRRTNSTT